MRTSILSHYIGRLLGMERQNYVFAAIVNGLESGGYAEPVWKPHSNDVPNAMVHNVTHPANHHIYEWCRILKVQIK